MSGIKGESYYGHGHVFKLRQLAVIWSHKYRYVFVELPNTGSTAVSQELIDSYAGERVEDSYPNLHKHAYYHLFERVAPPEAKEYFVFSSIRDPMDEAVSVFFRYRTNHQGRYTHPRSNKGVTARQLERYVFASEESASFRDFFLRYYRVPYDNWSLLAHRDFDFIIRFERIAQDFEEVLRRLGIEPVRPLPRANETAERGVDYLAYYPAGIHQRAVWIFGPFMQKWGYQFPSDWQVTSIPSMSRLSFRVLGTLRYVYLRYLRWSDSWYGALLRRKLAPKD